jgi:polyisoprenoid-binding protein YceI
VYFMNSVNTGNETRDNDLRSDNTRRLDVARSEANEREHRG